MTGDIRPASDRPVIISLSDDIEVSPGLIEYCQTRYAREWKRYERLEQYYMTENAIAGRVLGDNTKPNNRIAHAFARYITCIATAYFLGNGIKIECEDPEYQTLLENHYKSCMSDVKHYEEAKSMSKCGKSYELLYYDKDGMPRTAAIDPGNIIPIYGQDTDRFLTAAIRIYETKTLVGSTERTIWHADVYTYDRVFSYEKRGGFISKWRYVSERNHGFSDVPIIVRWNNTDQKGDYEDVLPQIDAYDRAQSDTANDLDYFTDAYLAVTGAEEIVSEESEGDGSMDPAKSIRTMKQERVLLLPEGGDVKFVTKNIADTPTENYKNRIYRDLFFLSLVPNLTDESFAGNLSGVAMKYKLFGIEELAAEKEKYFTSSETKKIRLITEYLNARNGTEYDWRTVKLSFDRSNIANLLEVSQIINNLRGMLSDETLIGMWPEVKDAAEELKKRVDEKASAENDMFPANIEAMLSDGTGQ